MANQANKQQAPDTRYIPVAQFDQYHPWPTPQSIRNRIHAAKRGTDADFLKCIKRAGGRVLVDGRVIRLPIDQLAFDDRHLLGGDHAHGAEVGLAEVEVKHEGPLHHSGVARFRRRGRIKHP